MSDEQIKIGDYVRWEFDNRWAEGTVKEVTDHVAMVTLERGNQGNCGVHLLLKNVKRIKRPGSHKVAGSAPPCQRCGHVFASKPDGFIDEALEKEVAAHQCIQEVPIQDGDYVRWTPKPRSDSGNWFEGTVVCRISSGAGWMVNGLKVERIGEIEPWKRNIGSGVVIGQTVDPMVFYGEVRKVERPSSQREIVTTTSTSASSSVILAYVTPQPPPQLELYDGLTAQECLERFQQLHREDVCMWSGDGRFMTGKQKAAARELWSAQLRAKVEASKERDRLQVQIEVDCEW